MLTCEFLIPTHRLAPTRCKRKENIVPCHLEFGYCCTRQAQVSATVLKLQRCFGPPVMQACTATVSLQKGTSGHRVARAARKQTQVVQATARADVTSRRSAALLIAAVPAILASPAFARDADKAKAAAEARKEQLAKAADEMRESGKTASAFSESQYAVSEDKSPNVHTRQEEGVRESAD